MAKNCNKLMRSDIGSEYLHFNLRPIKEMEHSSGIFYANGSNKIKEVPAKGSKQKGGKRRDFPEATPENRSIHYKSNGYYLNFNTVFGGRPEIVRVNTDEPHMLAANKMTNRNRRFDCVQPEWDPKCL